MGVVGDRHNSSFFLAFSIVPLLRGLRLPFRALVISVSLDGTAKMPSHTPSVE
jgi:hypothetical protein